MLKKWTHVCVVDHFSSLKPFEEEEETALLGTIIITEGEKARISRITDEGNYLIYTSKNKVSKEFGWNVSPEDFKKYFKEIKW